MDMNRYEVLYACDQRERERESACVRCVFVRLCVRELERMREKSVCVCVCVCVCELVCDACLVILNMIE
jgi:hypothetical protein